MVDKHLAPDPAWAEADTPTVELRHVGESPRRACDAVLWAARRFFTGAGQPDTVGSCAV